MNNMCVLCCVSLSPTHFAGSQPSNVSDPGNFVHINCTNCKKRIKCVCGHARIQIHITCILSFSCKIDCMTLDWLVVEPTHLKNFNKSIWESSQI